MRFKFMEGKLELRVLVFLDEVNGLTFDGSPLSLCDQPAQRIRDLKIVSNLSGLSIIDCFLRQISSHKKQNIGNYAQSRQY